LTGSIVPLGKLETVSLREAWPNEASNFTPWLAEDTNLTLLGEALGLQLELEAVEKPVGPFAADILAKESGAGRWVLIENQIEPTDHRHLGQLLTYAAGLDTHVVVWIAQSFREEHRAAIDFLNRATTEEYSFFGVQIELFRIGNSPLAPTFTLAAKPNNWSKQAQAGKQATQDELSPTQIENRRFWTELISAASDLYPALTSRVPYKSSWQCAERLRSSPNFYSECNAAFTSTGQLRIEAYLGGTLAKAVYYELLAQQAEIEEAFGDSLVWEELPKGQDSRIAYYMPGTQKRDNKQGWSAQRQWLLANWKKLADTLRPYINGVDLNVLSIDQQETN
jgi:hypothetical protein